MSFSQALDLIADDKPLQAREVLKAFNVKHVHFLDALTEIQKINYKDKEWERFFGRALFYRYLLIRDKGGVAFHQRPIVLEILALSKHCRFKAAAQIAHWGREYAKKNNPDQPIDEIEKSIELFAFNDLISEINKDKGSKKTKILMREMWAVNNKQMKLLTNPRNLRVKVESRCI